jgi:putative FmdB family regulatory protein
MPIYEYICKKCGTRFEVLHRSSEGIKIVCPKCKGEKAEKVLSVFGFSSGEKFVSSGSNPSCSTCSSKNCDTCG